MLPRPIIGLCGAAGSGKSSVASHLVEGHNFRLVKFSGPLKDMLRALGLGERDIEGDRKESPCPLLGNKTPRFAMQTLGLEWGRDTISNTLWVDAWRKAVDAVPEGVGVVVDDIRFPNEAQAMRDVGPTGLLVRIERPNQPNIAGNHVSEMLTFRSDVTVRNDGTIDALTAKIDELLRPASRPFV